MSTWRFPIGTILYRITDELTIEELVLVDNVWVRGEDDWGRIKVLNGKNEIESVTAVGIYVDYPTQGLEHRWSQVWYWHYKTIVYLAVRRGRGYNSV